jgi:PAS domain S-box-containing protein
MADKAGWAGAVLEGLTDPVYAVDCDWRMVVFNRAAEAYFGASREAVLGLVIWDLFPDGRNTPFETLCRKAMATGETGVFETPSKLRADRVVELKIGPAGEGGVAVILHDITERRRTDPTLRAAPNRSAEILESISDAFFAVDEDFRFTYVNRVAESWWDIPRDEIIGRVCWEVFPETVDTPIFHATHAAVAEQTVQRVEALSPNLDRWVEISIFPAHRGLSVYFRDIQQRKEAERRQRLLVNELNHRVKNTLAIVQGLVRQTLGSARDLEHAQDAMTARLLALAGAHDVITREEWTGADLAEVIRVSLAPQLDRPDRLMLDGPRVVLTPQSALSLSLAFHELTTNALKYGALSAQAGLIAMTWRIGGGRLKLTWREQGGPPVTPPLHRGFGSRLIERGLAAEVGGKVSMRYEPDGLICEIDADLGRVSPQDGLGFLSHPA